MTKEKIIYFIIILLVVFMSSCSIFETRTPEDPIGDSGVFVPPTTPDIVIDNLLEAFNKKNSENYYSCFSKNKFEFLPTSEILARYPSLFQEWNINNEKQYIIALSTNLQNAVNPNLIFTNKEFVSFSADSAVFIADYFIKCEFIDISIPTNYQGKVNFTIKNELNSEWTITNWKDFQNNDTVNTWSYLKALFSN